MIRALVSFLSIITVAGQSAAGQPSPRDGMLMTITGVNSLSLTPSPSLTPSLSLTPSPSQTAISTPNKNQSTQISGQTAYASPKGAPKAAPELNSRSIIVVSSVCSIIAISILAGVGVNIYRSQQKTKHILNKQPSRVFMNPIAIITNSENSLPPTDQTRMEPTVFTPTHIRDTS